MRIGSLCYGCNCGLGMLARSFFTAGVINDVYVLEHPNYPTNKDWYPGFGSSKLRAPNKEAIYQWIKGLDLIIFFETPFLWELPGLCKALKIPTVLVPDHEWFPENPKAGFDLYLCGSPLDVDCFKDRGRTELVTMPVDPTTWKLRERADKFIHNAGHLGSKNHKGTEEILAAIPYVKSPIELTIRSQTPLLEKILNKYPESSKDSRVKVEIGEIPHADLFKEGSVYLAPEKYNAMSLPLQEARAAGMLVMTSDRYPHNTWLPKGPLVPVSSYRRAQVAQGYLMFDEAVINPEVIAATIDAWFGRDISDYSRQGLTWAEENSWTALKGKYMKLLESLL